MNKAADMITKEQEEKRLRNFKELAENWDKLPERVQGKLDGAIYMARPSFWIEKRKRGE